MSVAGVAHPVERHLAKVEVASSSLVTRSIKKKDHTKVWSFFFMFAVTGSNHLNATVQWTVAGFRLDGIHTLQFALRANWQRASSPAPPQYDPSKTQRRPHNCVAFFISLCVFRSLLLQDVKHLHQHSGVEIGSCSEVQGKPKES